MFVLICVGFFSFEYHESYYRPIIAYPKMNNCNKTRCNYIAVFFGCLSFHDEFKGLSRFIEFNFVFYICCCTRFFTKIMPLNSSSQPFTLESPC